MKAVARKIKDNEWLAEVRTLDNEDCEFFDKHYPIVFNSDKEWLENNNMNGMEVEGVLGKNQGSYSDHNVFYLSADFKENSPSQERSLLEEAMIEWTNQNNGLMPDTPPPEFQKVQDGEWVQPVMVGYKMACCDCNLVHSMDFRIHEGRIQFRAGRNEKYTEKLRAATPQTGRTYTEGEMKGFAEFVKNNLMAYDENVDIVNKLFPEYLKQNPKP